MRPRGGRLGRDRRLDEFMPLYALIILAGPLSARFGLVAGLVLAIAASAVVRGAWSLWHAHRARDEGGTATPRSGGPHRDVRRAR